MKPPRKAKIIAVKPGGAKIILHAGRYYIVGPRGGMRAIRKPR